MNKISPITINSGSYQLDGLLQDLRPGDNVVWQIDRFEDYAHFAELFAEQSIRDGSKCVYFRFAPHPPLVKTRAGITVFELDPTPGFDYFSGKVHEIIEKQGKERPITSLITCLLWSANGLPMNYWLIFIRSLALIFLN
jgi:hypothetical protein